MNLDSLNRKYLGFLEKDYGFKYSKSVFENQNAKFSILVTGDNLPILSYIEVFIWFTTEPKCTQISFEWIARYFGYQLDLEYSPKSLLKNYSKLSSALRECMTR